MEYIKTKSYVEKQYKAEFMSYKRIEEQVLERDPMKIENDGEMECFRFFDREFTLDDGRDFLLDPVKDPEFHEIINVEKSNFSSWIYFGERLSYSEFLA